MVSALYMPNMWAGLQKIQSQARLAMSLNEE